MGVLGSVGSTLIQALNLATTPSNPLKEAIEPLTTEEVTKLYTQASYLSQLMYTLLIVMIAVIAAFIILIGYVIWSNNKLSKRMSESLDKASNGDRQESKELAKALNALSSVISKMDSSLNGQYVLIEKLLDRVLKDMGGDHKALFDRFSEHELNSSNQNTMLLDTLNQLSTRMGEMYSWCVSRDLAKEEIKKGCRAIEKGDGKNVK